MVKKQKGKKARKEALNALNDKISILTPTVKSRQHCLFILAECIKKQTYLSRISQWVIVSADKDWTKTDFDYFIKSLQSVIPSVKIDGKYVNNESAISEGWPIVDDYEAIGYLRNITNIIATGDYIVCMDDDDYYPPKRVEHAVSALRKSTKEMAGCSGHIIYETDLKLLLQFKRFGPNHSVNNSLAYKKSYIESGALYDSTKKHAEERSFLKDYATPMIQLDPLDTIIQMVHFNNTYSKRHLLIRAEWMTPDKKNVSKISSYPNKFIPQNILDKYEQALYYSESTISEYDIVYYLGLGAPIWSPYDKKLGGSEQAVKHLVDAWSNLGYKVAVYGEFSDAVTQKSISEGKGIYLNFSNFKCSTHYKYLILWRRYGTHPLISWTISADHLYLDLHDSIPLTETCLDNLDKVDKIILRSDFHSKIICSQHKAYDLNSKMLAIKNGVRINDFVFKQNDPQRDLYRFCWCSCYKRGLMQILAWMWPLIKQKYHSATFHVYYGMDNVAEEDFKKQMNVLLKQPGVVDHGRQGVDIIIKEKQTASFHLYYSKTTAETDCISIRESVSAGCIPIISNYNVFGEREGLKVPGDPHNYGDHQKVAFYINELLSKPDEVERIRNNMCGKEVGWDSVAKLWPIKKD